MQKTPDPSASGVFMSLPNSDKAGNARDQLMQKISENSNLPALGGSVSKVVQLASSNDEAVRSLAYFILSDVALTQKVLMVSNAACYRTSSGTPVTTISKAIFMLGFDTVKSVALTMLLVDRMSGKRGNSVRAELGHALASSVFARELARRSQFKDAEEAAVAALFKNIGRVLVASYDHRLYMEITALCDSGTAPAVASMQVLGCTYEMLANAVLAEWKIPETIIHALAPLPSGVLKQAKTRQEWMQQVAVFSSTAATLIGNMNDQADDVASKALLTRFGAALGLDQAKLGALFLTVGEEARMALRSTGWTSSDPVVGASTMSAEESEVAQVEEHGIPPGLLFTSVSTVPLQVDARHPSGKPINARDLLLAGVQDVTEMVASGRCKTNDLIMLVLETLYRSMGFRFATVCLKDIKTNQFRARISLGENNIARQASFVFSADSSRDLFHLAMENDADLLISDATDAKIKSLIPLWHRALLPDARSFIVLPLLAQNNPIGLFYADRVQPAPEGVPSDESTLIKMLKGQVTAALNGRS